MTGFPKWFRLPALLPVLVLLGGGCAYFNTFYNAQTFYKEGVKFKEQRSMVQAKAKFEKSIEKSALVISRWPKSQWVDDATYLVGMCYYEMGSYEKAIRHFEWLVLAFPESKLVPEAELYRGLALLKSEDFGVAGVVLGAVRAKYPQLRAKAAFYQAEAFYEREDYPQAVDSLSGFVEQFPRSRYVPEAVLHLAESGFRLERWEDAERWYEQCVRLERDPKKRVSAKLKVVACRLAQGKGEQAAEQVRDVIGRYPDLDDEAYLLLGRSLAELEQHEDAIAAWVKVRGSNALGAEAFFRVGKYREEHKDFLTARAYYDTAKSRRANSDYGVLAVKRLSLLDALAERDSSDVEPAEAMFLLAEVHNLNLADYDEAMRLYQSVHDSFPESDWAPKGLFAKAWILKHVEDDSAAVPGLLRQIIAEYPDTEYADESRRWLGLPVPYRAPKEPEPVVVVVDSAELVMEPVEAESVPSPEPGEKPEFAEEELGEVSVRIEDMPGRFEEPVEAESVPEPRPESVPGPVPAEPDTAQPEVALEIVHFDYDRWLIKEPDIRALVRGAGALLERPEIEVEIVGHCDPRGTDEYNTKLGLKRARAVRKFLVRSGVAEERLTVRSEGESRPISTTPEEYWLDRRVEFKVR